MPSQLPPIPDKMRFQLNLRQRGISDQAVLKAMEDVPRELFVAPVDRAEAYADTPLGISCGQTISQPFVVAYMTEQLSLRRNHRVLEIGTGSGYQAAVLSKLCREVISLERYRMLADRARGVLADIGCNNVEVVLADGYDVPDTLGTFDRIIVTAAMTDVPQALLSRLEPDGVLIAPVGPFDGVQSLTRFSHVGGRSHHQELLRVRFVPMLPGIAKEL